MPDRKQPLGTEDLEAGMRPSKAFDVVTIATILVVVLMLVNPRALVEWTRQPQPGPLIAALERPAVAWHGWMTALGPAAWFDDLRQRVQKAIAG
jgi:hypothetical protein